MRIASLLPSATEIVCAIGLQDELVAITHECDWPPSVVGKPVVTRSVHDLAAVGSREINARVTASVHGGSSLYELDEEALAAVEPDLILTQELCQVCAVSYREVNEVARRIDADIAVVSLEPTSIEGILNTITTVGAMAEVEDAAIDVVEASARAARRRRAARLRRGAMPGASASRVVALEWLDPPFAVGHWVPEQIRRAGGWDLLGADGEKSYPTTWEAVADVDPEMLFLMPCGFHLAETVREWARTEVPPWIAELPGGRRGAVFALDGSAYFSVPGRASSTGSRCSPRSWIPRGSSTSHRRVAGRRSESARCRSSRRSPACGAGPRTRPGAATTSRAGRSSAPTASARRATTASCASGCARRSRSGRRRRARRRGTAARRARRRRRRDRARRRRDGGRTAATDLDQAMVEYYEARAPEYDDWYLRRGRYERGAIHDAAWNAELDAAGRWLDGLPWSGEIVELAAGTGWWSPLLASRGELSLYDTSPAALDRARERLRGPWAARAPPRARRVGRAGSRRSTGCSPASG